MSGEIVVRRRIKRARRTWSWELSLECGHVVHRNVHRAGAITTRCHVCEREAAERAADAAVELVDEIKPARPRGGRGDLRTRRGAERPTRARMREIVGRARDSRGRELDVLECGHTLLAGKGAGPRRCRPCVASPWSIRRVRREARC